MIVVGDPSALVGAGHELLVDHRRLEPTFPDRKGSSPMHPKRLMWAVMQRAGICVALAQILPISFIQNLAFLARLFHRCQRRPQLQKTSLTRAAEAPRPGGKSAEASMLAAVFACGLLVPYAGLLNVAPVALHAGHEYTLFPIAFGLRTLLLVPYTLNKRIHMVMSSSGRFGMLFLSVAMGDMALRTQRILIEHPPCWERLLTGAFREGSAVVALVWDVILQPGLLSLRQRAKAAFQSIHNDGYSCRKDLNESSSAKSEAQRSQLFTMMTEKRSWWKINK